MSALPFLTSELQALAKEAGRRHGEVKEVRLYVEQVLHDDVTDNRDGFWGCV
jgi:hypothetical protein